MKQVTIIALLLLTVACNNKDQTATVDTDLVKNSASADGKAGVDLPEISFEEKEYDFGKITQGERVKHEFTFTNTGEANLLISDARGSCGCTVPEWPKEPILPGKKGVIKVEFNSEGKSGSQEKTITIVTNGEPATRILKIRADIVVPETAI